MNPGDYFNGDHMNFDNIKQAYKTGYAVGFKEGSEYAIQLLKKELIRRGYTNEKTDKVENDQAAEK